MIVGARNRRSGELGNTFTTHISWTLGCKHFLFALWPKFDFVANWNQQ